MIECGLGADEDIKMQRIKTNRWDLYIATNLPVDTKETDFEIHFINLKARTKAAAKAEALEVLKLHGMKLLEDNALVFEFERVYETRWDCMAEPERVRQAA